MPIVTQASHIDIQKSENYSAMTTVTENIRKARRALYSLMGTGVHGENGLVLIRFAWITTSKADLPSSIAM
jgi:hypothetical protein